MLGGVDNCLPWRLAVAAMLFDLHDQDPTDKDLHDKKKDDKKAAKSAGGESGAES